MKKENTQNQTENNSKYPTIKNQQNATIQTINTTLENFKYALLEEEKSKNTIEKYIRDVKAFLFWLTDKELCKNAVIEYKAYLLKSYAPRSVNSILASINCFLDFSDKGECKVKAVKIQAEVYSPKEKELSKAEYFRLLKASENNERLNLLLQTICAMGIRVSELNFITVDAVNRGIAVVSCKGKTRKVFIVKELRKKLLSYIKKQKIKEGAVFVTRSGKPINRTNIWREMKSLCKKAGVSPDKVFPIIYAIYSLVHFMTWKKAYPTLRKF